jgi:hypothetical protein
MADKAASINKRLIQNINAGILETAFFVLAFSTSVSFTSGFFQVVDWK